MSKDSHVDFYHQHPTDPNITHPLKWENVCQLYGRSTAEEEEEDNKCAKVYLRIKPRKHKLEEQELLFIKDESTLLLRSIKGPDVEYKFTYIFGPETEQEAVFNNSILPSVRAFISGQHCLLLTYGVSSAEKTFTIQGTPKNPGIIPRAIAAIFNRIKDQQSNECKFKPHLATSVLELDENEVHKEQTYKRNLLSALRKNVSTDFIQTLVSTQEHNNSSQSEFWSCSSSSVAGIQGSFDDSYVKHVAYSAWVSFAEVYNENIYDLLVPVIDRKRQCLILGQDSVGDVYIKGLKHVWVNSAEEAYQILLCGQENLNYASTNVNSFSSRSHCVFSLKLICEFKDLNKCQLSRFSFCDLAGTERAKKTKNVGEHLKKSELNTALHHLGMCLRVIRNNRNRRDKLRIPFRDCKLTQVFQNALLGRDAIRMIVNVSLDPYLHNETAQVLKFSAIANQIVAREQRPCQMRKDSSLPRYIKKVSYYSNSTSIAEDADEDMLSKQDLKEKLLNVEEDCKQAVKCPLGLKRELDKLLNAGENQKV